MVELSVLLPFWATLTTVTTPSEFLSFLSILIFWSLTTNSSIDFISVHWHNQISSGTTTEWLNESGLPKLNAPDSTSESWTANNRPGLTPSWLGPTGLSSLLFETRLVWVANGTNSWLEARTLGLSSHSPTLTVASRPDFHRLSLEVRQKISKEPPSHVPLRIEATDGNWFDRY